MHEKAFDIKIKQNEKLVVMHNIFEIFLCWALQISRLFEKQINRNSNLVIDSTPHYTLLNFMLMCTLIRGFQNNYKIIKNVEYP